MVFATVRKDLLENEREAASVEDTIFLFMLTPRCLRISGPRVGQQCRKTLCGLPDGAACQQQKRIPFKNSLEDPKGDNPRKKRECRWRHLAGALSGVTWGIHPPHLTYKSWTKVYEC
jgi:hypothetical protein